MSSSIMESYLAIKEDKNTYTYTSKNTDGVISQIWEQINIILSQHQERIKETTIDTNWTDKEHKVTITLIDDRILVMTIDENKFNAKCGDLEFKYEYEVPQTINYQSVATPNICNSGSYDTFNPMASTIGLNIGARLDAFLRTVDYISVRANMIDQKYIDDLENRD